MKLSTAKYRLLALVLLSIIGVSVAQAAPPLLSIKSAVYNKKSSSLIVKTKISGGGLLTLLHSKGGVLGQTKKAEEIFTIPLAQLGEIPCQVEARVGELKISKAVAGAGSECSKVPVCKILKPANNIKTDIKIPVHFEAQFALKDKKAGPLAVEWDFAGGVMGHPYQKPLKGNKPILSGKVSTDATFVRDNSRYHVRFMATDTQGRHCESGIYVDVGQLPTDLPDASALTDMVEASQTNAPAKGSALKIPAGEKVVLPYQDWTMQTATDARTVPNVYVVYGPQVNNINATVYEKARKPPVIGPDKVELKYSAASNPADPVGPNSINSTSQNWPLGTSLMQASVQKSDYFETYTRPADVTLADGYYSYSYTGFLSPELLTEADEGYHNPALFPPINLDHGRYMPGKTGPYVDNIPQSFSDYVDVDNLFAARMLPLTDIDDSGRVNTAPLFRIEARDLNGDAPTTIASTDIAVSAERDFHCRECHAKGKMGTNRDYSKIPDFALNYYEPDSDSIFDQEYAAIRNTLGLHPRSEYYTGRMNGLGSSATSDSDGNIISAINDGPLGCGTGDGSCHTTAMATTAFGKPLGDRYRGGKLSMIMHWVHGQFQYNANKDDVVRYDAYGVKGLVKRFNPDNYWDPDTGSMSNSLFPVKDKNGNILPMEQNCLKCHSGKREQCYRDRMYTAGVTCYQCHGDMLAVSGYKKSVPGPDGSIQRQPWIDEPDCGSCHTGNANQGKNGNADFFSGGVRKLAFDKYDRTATPRQPDLLNPDEIRFAVPITSMALGNNNYTAPDGSVTPFVTKTPLYRVGKDNHGQVACGACHGAAHAIWPNRDPNANDNVTSLQLQGHSGPIAECSVCHADDAFAQRDDLDEGIRAADPKEHVLGGPHNTHPINDRNWWEGANADDSANEVSGNIKGGWHNDYAKFPGRLGEDQCAACHGNDHLGTRLSKTPVDREFVTAKGKKIKVKAGTAIGCNLCHSVIQSCTKSPASLNCGKPSEQVTKSVNQAPVITSSADTVAVMGEDYSHAITATDPEGGKLSYQLEGIAVDGINIDADTGIVTVPASTIEMHAHDGNHSFGHPDIFPAYLFDYYVAVRDSQGAQTVQMVRVAFNCPDGLIWDGNMHACGKIALFSYNPIAGLNGGEAYRYEVVAKQRSGKPLSYSLSGPSRDEHRPQHRHDQLANPQ